MRILALGDFHGRFPGKFEKLIKKEKVDIVVSNGDFFPFVYRKLWFKHCYHTDNELWDVIGRKMYLQLVKKDLKEGEKAIRGLGKLPVPVITVVGNVDYTSLIDSYDEKPSKDDLRRKDLLDNILKRHKNVRRFDYSYFKFGDFIFIGAYGGSSPGKVGSKTFKRYRKKLDNLFRKYRKENKEGKVIFVSHNVPYNTKLDKIGKHAHEAVRGKHYGSKLVRRTIDRWKPILHVGGHIHEGMGKQKVGRTLCVNTGAVHEGQGAIIDVSEKGRVKVKFI